MFPGRFRDLALRALAAVLGGRSDGQIERLLMPAAAQRLLLWGVAASYDETVVPGFTGVLAFRLLRPQTGSEPLEWLITITDSGAKGSAGVPVGTPSASIRMPLADFVRLTLGLEDPAEAMLGGRATLHGDIQVISRLAEMFRAVAVSH